MATERIPYLILLTRCLVILIMCNLFGYSDGNDDAKRLYHDLLIQNKYNKLIRPIGNNTNKPLMVRMGIRLSQIIDVDELNQVMTTNVWLRQEWYDFKLTWHPVEYGGVDRLYVPSELIWLPDIVLYNKITCLQWYPEVNEKNKTNSSCRPKTYCCLLLSYSTSAIEVDLTYECSTNPESRVIITSRIDIRDLNDSGECNILEVTENNHNNQ
ncbi:ACH1-like protein [Mya arenaria]|uniref:ACH1-like protein n=1 Tax=Mya arenaria TaxID=6604 RepID=A0ABY7DKX4_MYAAR|nr:ACH1-like protein [Mya arenaria]